MIQVKLTLEEEQVDFLRNYQRFGFSSRSAMVRAALRRLAEELRQQRLAESAELYAEIYQEDKELQELTASAIDGWPADEPA